MGRFSQKCLCYSFEILHGLLSNNKPESSRSRRASVKSLGQKLGTDGRTDGQTDRQMDRQDQIWSRPATKNIRNSMKNILGGTSINPILTGKMGKFGVIDSADTRAGKFPLLPMGG